MPTVTAASSTLPITTQDVGIYRDAANVVAQRNLASAQASYVYNTTDAALANYERGEFGWTGNSLTIGTRAAGTGSARAIQLMMNGTNILFVGTDGSIKWNTDATYDLGGIGNRARSLYLSGFVALQSPSTQSGTTYTVLSNDAVVIFTSASTVTATLPAASSYTGRILHLKTTGGAAVNSASSNVVPLAGGAASTAILAATAGKWAQLHSDGTNWIVMAAN